MRRISPKHANLTFENERVALEFFWDPYLNSTLPRLFSSPPAEAAHTSGDARVPHAVLLGAGLWYARYLDGNYASLFSAMLDTISENILTREHRRTGGKLLLRGEAKSEEPIFIMAPVLNPHQGNLDEDRARTLTPSRISKLNEQLHNAMQDHDFHIISSFSEMTRDFSLAYETDGIHVAEHVVSSMVDVFLNLACNMKLSKSYPFDISCCMPRPPVDGVQTFLLTMAILVPLIILVQNLGKHVWPSWLHMWLEWFSGHVFVATAILSSALLYCYGADRSIYFDKVAKEPSARNFLALSGITLTIGALSISRFPNKIDPVNEKISLQSQHEGSILSRDQTEEWKGWMQVIILLYHYFGMSKVLGVYQFIRLLVASYLFMTGFGHTLYFRKTNDFSLQRAVGVLLRLNLLGCLLPYIMGTDYDFYYFPALCSFWFVVVYVTCYGGHSCRFLGNFYLRVIVSLGTVNILVLYPDFLESVFSGLHRICRMNLNPREFRFRVSLDMYIVYVGMLVGELYLKAIVLPDGFWEDRLTALYRRRVLMQHLLALTSLTILGLYVLFCKRFSDKYESNAFHPFTSPLAILAYVGLRNATSRLRLSHSRVFAWVGRYSLETYILQYHIWLAGDTKGLLRLPILGRFQVERSGSSRMVDMLQFTIITVYFLWTSWALGRATGVLTRWFVGRDPPTTGSSLPLGRRDRTEWNSYYWVRLMRKCFPGSLTSRLLLALGMLLILNWLWDPQGRFG